MTADKPVKKIMLAFLLGLLLYVFPYHGALAANGKLTIPENTTIIEEEAFEGIAASEVFLPEGLKTIGSRAFAESRIQTVHFPKSVKKIAEDAFEGCGELVVMAAAGSYAYQYCVQHGFTIIPNGLTEPESVSLGIGDRYLDDDPWTSEDLYPGMRAQLSVGLSPETASTDLAFTSSNPEVVTVDDLGIVTCISKGTAAITVTTGNGKTAALELEVKHETGKLTYTKLKDGSGYEVTGCEENAMAVYIPSAYNGLPVKAVSGKAFIKCRNLRSITVDPRQETFYVDHGVLFTDSPVKTLVRFPNLYSDSSFYYVPDDTIAIAPYAFSGFNEQNFNTGLYFPDGLTTIGDGAFSEIHTQIFVYVPDSVTKIGKNLLQGQEANVAFYCADFNTAYEYAMENHIPCSVAGGYEEKSKTAGETEPDEKNAEDALEVNPEKIVSIHPDYWHHQLDVSFMYWKYDISKYQKEKPSEVRILFSEQWPELIPSSSGRTRNGYPPQTGLYGIGHTEGETWLRGYDLEGTVVGVRKVSGDFVFSLPGAFDLGISGGSNTVIQVTPFRPVFISKAGVYPLDRQNMHTGPDGAPFQIYVLMLPGAAVSFDFPYELNCFERSMEDTDGNELEQTGIGSHYSIMSLKVRNPNLGDRYSQISFNVDYMQKLVNNSEFACYAKASYGVTTQYAKEIYALYTKIKEKMQKYYFPANYPLNKVKVMINGNYPGVWEDSTIELDEQSTKGINENLYVLLHEPVHAVDRSYPYFTTVCPEAWTEGRAEYIYGKVYYDVTGTPSDRYIGNYNWDYLSAEDRADFFHYFYYSTTRETHYPVGYYFVDYLCRTYGENIMQKIMEKIVKIDGSAYSKDYSEQFKACVTSVTDPDVFQNFVRDVIEK